jgi:putative membrane protein
LHHAARASVAILLLEQASFLLVGLALWVAVFGGDGARRRERAAAGIGGLLLTSMHMTLLGVLLSVAARPLYGHLHAGAAPLPFGLSPLQDQHLGGILMLAIGGTAYLVGALWLLAGLLRERDEAVADG